MQRVMISGEDLVIIVHLHVHVAKKVSTCLTLYLSCTCKTQEVFHLI